MMTITLLPLTFKCLLACAMYFYGSERKGIALVSMINSAAVLFGVVLWVSLWDINKRQAFVEMQLQGRIHNSSSIIENRKIVAEESKQSASNRKTLLSCIWRQRRVSGAHTFNHKFQLAQYRWKYCSLIWIRVGEDDSPIHEYCYALGRIIICSMLLLLAAENETESFSNALPVRVLRFYWRCQ